MFRCLRTIPTIAVLARGNLRSSVSFQPGNLRRTFPPRLSDNERDHAFGDDRRPQNGTHIRAFDRRLNPLFGYDIDGV